jgi:xylulokinase
MTILLGIDTSTTATKALLVNEQGRVTASATSEYPYDTPQSGWTEQPASSFWEGTVHSIRAVLEKANLPAREVSAIGLTGQMHGMTLLDKQGATIRPVILWNDQRTADQCAEITRIVGEKRVLELTGNPVLTGFTAPKIVWVKQHEPEHFRQIAKILLPKDYVRYKLSGEFFSEVSDASGTSLFNVGQRQWSDEMLDAAGVPRVWMPEVTESPVISSRLSREAAQLTGLLEGTPIAGGGGDQAAGAVGMGIVHEGSVSLQLGTSGVVFAASDHFQPESQGRLHTFCHAVPGKWHWMGVMLSAAGSFRWYRDVLGDLERQAASQSGAGGVGPQDAYDLLTQSAATAPAGCVGLFFLPYLTGERTPHPDPDARGAFVGLTIRHKKAHLTRAVLEGVSYGLRDSLELMREMGMNVTQLRASGGGIKSAFWRQMLADVFGTEITTVNSTEGAAYGAALLAGVGAGVWSSVEAACENTIRATGSTIPGPDRSTYDWHYPIYRDLYAALAPTFKRIAELPFRADG